MKCDDKTCPAYILGLCVEFSDATEINKAVHAEKLRRKEQVDSEVRQVEGQEHFDVSAMAEGIRLAEDERIIKAVQAEAELEKIDGTRKQAQMTPLELANSTKEIDQMAREVFENNFAPVFNLMGGSSLGNIFSGILAEVFAMPNMEQKVKPEAVIFEEGTKFTYYGKNDNPSHNGVIVVASKFHNKEAAVQYGVSYCSPDDQFDKKYGRELAYKRMQDEPIRIPTYLKKHHDISLRILCDLFCDIAYPSWADKVVKDGIDYHVNNC